MSYTKDPMQIVAEQIKDMYAKPDLHSYAADAIVRRLAVNISKAFQDQYYGFDYESFLRDCGVIE